MKYINKIKLTLSIIIGLLIFIPIKALAYEISKDDKIYVSGEPIGIRLETGIEVVGTFGVVVDGNIIKPWEACRIKEGDKIISLSNEDVTSKADVIRILNKYHDNEMNIVYKRGNKEYESKIKAATSEDGYTLGLYIKDSVLGVGTLTYYVKEANIYGSLGHRITNDDYYDGQIFEAKVTGIKKPTRDEAGEKKATIIGDSIGNIKVNSDTGIHGNGNSNLDTGNMQLMNYKTKESVTLGDAQIWTCINGVKVESFDIEITSLKKQSKSDIKGICFKVVDEDLLDKTGGIVQGMSGSPIIQDDAIIGAVTHVSLNDSTVGYGIYIEWMFEDMGIEIVE